MDAERGSSFELSIPKYQIYFCRTSTQASPTRKAGPNEKKNTNPTKQTVKRLRNFRKFKSLVQRHYQDAKRSPLFIYIIYIYVRTSFRRIRKTVRFRIGLVIKDALFVSEYVYVGNRGVLCVELTRNTYRF